MRKFLMCVKYKKVIKWFNCVYNVYIIYNIILFINFNFKVLYIFCNNIYIYNMFEYLNKI